MFECDQFASRFEIYLANNGLFSFLGPIYQFVPTPFPLNDGRRVIAGFWSDIDTRSSIPSGNKVYYQIHVNQSNTIVFEKAVAYVQQYFPGERSFNPSMIITGTWYRVGAYSYQTNLVNTFQIILATDEIRSFAFLFYNDLQWASPSTSSLIEVNSSSEIGGQAGFNAGDSIIYEMLPYSRTSYVRRLVNTSNVNVPSLFVFRIDSDTMLSVAVIMIQIRYFDHVVDLNLVLQQLLVKVHVSQILRSVQK
ncbi:unnamed protein product [Rotaria sp. Silwood2]|nr:unnamed protein product [Rotaria sp. Silwood2]